MSLVHFGPFEGNIASNRLLGLFMIKDPPAAAKKKELFQSAQKKRVAARESSACKVDPQRGPTSKNLIRQKTCSSKEGILPVSPEEEGGSQGEHDQGSTCSSKEGILPLSPGEESDSQGEQRL